MKIRAKANTHIRHPKPFLRRRRKQHQLERLIARVTNQTTVRTHLETRAMRLVSKHYVGGPDDRIDQWQLQTRRGTLTVSRAADGWSNTPFLLYTKGRLIVGTFAFDRDAR